MSALDNIKVGDIVTLDQDGIKYQVRVKEILISHIVLTDGNNDLTIKIRWNPEYLSDDSDDQINPEYYAIIREMPLQGFTLKRALAHYTSIKDHVMCAKIKQVLNAEARGELYK